MPRNIEIKARIAGVAALRPLAARLADTDPTVIEQDDTFFACPHGRLKLRDQFAGGAELIFYQRADERGPKESFYLRVPVPDPEALGEFLELEVVLREGEAAAEGIAEAGRIMAQLGVTPQQLIQGAYVDHLRHRPQADDRHGP